MNFFIIFLTSLSVLCSLSTLYFVLSRRKLAATNTSLNEKLTALEAKVHVAKQAPRASESNEKKVVKNTHQAQNFSSELLELRKETAHLKDELRKTKEVIHTKDKLIKEKSHDIEEKLLSAREENARLIEQLKNLEQGQRQLQQASQGNSAQVSAETFEEAQSQLSKIKSELNAAKTRNVEFERMLKSENGKLAAAQEKLKNVQSELTHWEELAKLPGIKQIGAAEFKTWLERAYLGRKMYRLMRQMRELSDEKLSSYQEGVSFVSSWALKQMKKELPTINSGEIPSDRLLSAAWSAIVESEQPAVVKSETPKLNMPDSPVL